MRQTEGSTMTTHITCDYCGELIDADDTWAQIKVAGDLWDQAGESFRYVYGARIGHYHTRPGHDSASCYRRTLDAIYAAQRRAGSNDRAAAETAWRQMPRERRETLVFQALDDDRLTIRELTERLGRALGCSAPDQLGRLPLSAYQSGVGNLVKRMLREGQLGREPETFNKTHRRYRYFRRRELEGAIAELDRAYREIGGDE